MGGKRSSNLFLVTSNKPAVTTTVTKPSRDRAAMASTGNMT